MDCTGLRNKEAKFRRVLRGRQLVRRFSRFGKRGDHIPTAGKSQWVFVRVFSASSSRVWWTIGAGLINFNLYCMPLTVACTVGAKFFLRSIFGVRKFQRPLSTLCRWLVILLTCVIIDSKLSANVHTNIACVYTCLPLLRFIIETHP